MLSFPIKIKLYSCFFSINHYANNGNIQATSNNADMFWQITTHASNFFINIKGQVSFVSPKISYKRTNESFEPFSIIHQTMVSYFSHRKKKFIPLIKKACIYFVCLSISYLEFLLIRIRQISRYIGPINKNIKHLFFSSYAKDHSDISNIFFVDSAMSQQKNDFVPL